MDLGIQGKTALVAAASDGLGKGVALRLATEGAHIVICARNAQRVEEAVAEIRSTNPKIDVHGFATDLSSADEIVRLGDHLREKNIEIDILINNAGGPPPGASEDIDDEQWRQAFELTMMSTVRLTRLALSHMRSQQWGRIINITSYSVKQPMPQMVLSNSVRMSVVGWAKTLSNEVATDGITVNNVLPGATATERLSSIIANKAEKTGKSIDTVSEAMMNSVPAKRFAEPQEIAAAIAFLASDLASYINGINLPVDGGRTKSL